jgi:hypothetical protein
MPQQLARLEVSTLDFLASQANETWQLFAGRVASPDEVHLLFQGLEHRLCRTVAILSNDALDMLDAFRLHHLVCDIER